MYALTIFGTNKDAMNAYATYNGQKIRLSNRLLALYGPGFPEITRPGSASVQDWLAASLGDDSKIKADTEIIAEPSDTCFDKHLPIHIPSLLLFLKEAKKIAKQDSPRNYAAVFAIDRDALVATDGFRLIWKPIGNVGETIAVPIASAPAITKFLSGPGDAKIYLSEDKTTIRMTRGDWTLYVHTSPVMYPRWRSVIATKGEGRFIGKNDLRSLKETAKTHCMTYRTFAEKTNNPLPVMGLHFNAQFIRDMPKGDTIVHQDDGLLAIIGPINAVIVAVKTPEK